MSQSLLLDGAENELKSHPYHDHRNFKLISDATTMWQSCIAKRRQKTLASEKFTEQILSYLQ
jgi:hypothetical protein